MFSHSWATLCWHKPAERASIQALFRGGSPACKLGMWRSGCDYWRWYSNTSLSFHQREGNGAATNDTQILRRRKLKSCWFPPVQTCVCVCVFFLTFILTFLKLMQDLHRTGKLETYGFSPDTSPQPHNQHENISACPEKHDNFYFRKVGSLLDELCPKK